MALEIRSKLQKGNLAVPLLIIFIIAVLGAGVYAARSLGLFAPGLRPNKRIAKEYFIDEETGDVDARSVSEIPPLPGKSGKPTVVIAHYFTTTTDAAKKLMYLQRYPLPTKHALEAQRDGQPLTTDDLNALNEEFEVRLPEPNSPWYPEDTPEGLSIVNTITTLDPDIRKVRQVYPK